MPEEVVAAIETNTTIDVKKRFLRFLFLSRFNVF